MTTAPRRHVLLGSFAGFVGGLAGCASRGAREVWVSAQGADASEFGASWTGADGDAQTVVVGLRGHDVWQHPLYPERVVLVARRPGRELVEVDVLARSVSRRVSCSNQHEMGGHACFSRDGTALFTAESNYESGEGRIVVRDARDYRTLDEYPSHGVGPHELALMPDGRTLAVANGGLRTHPSTGDEVLNLDTMQSRLTFLDSRDGRLLEEHWVDEPKASIRHLDVNDRGEIAVALQMQREGSDHRALAPLAAVYDARGLRVLTGPETLLLRCNDYMGSARINPTTRVAGYTSPRGNIALFWRLDDGELVAHHSFHDVCGIAVSLDHGRFVLSNSAGQLRCLDARTLEELPELRVELTGFEWDNHLRAIELPS